MKEVELLAYSGKWEVIPSYKNAIEGDLGLTLMDAAKHHAISVPFGTVVSTSEKLVFQ